MSKKPFKILSIDGGGIRGVFPSKFLANLEEELKSRGKKNWQIYQNFDLICGSSTGGIIAIALALGIPAREIHELYIDNAHEIFGKKRNRLWQLLRSSYKRDTLEDLVRAKFKSIDGKEDLRLKDCKTAVCVPVFDLFEGSPSVYKSKYHSNFIRDYHIPAYHVALATSAAPTYFDPYSANYIDLKGVKQSFSNKVDGGVFANNPTLVGIIEAQEAFKIELSDLKVLSVGTGHQTFSDGRNKRNWGILYWINPNRKRIMDLFMQGQSQLAENLISLMQNGIDKERSKSPSFIYDRVTVELNNSMNIKLDETNPEKLKRLSEKASRKFHDKATRIIDTYID